MVEDREELQVGAGGLTELLVGDAGETALGVLHHHDGLGAEHMRGDRQAAHDVGRDAPPGIADHVGIAEVQPEDREHVDTGVHAGDDGHLAARALVVDLSAGGGDGVRIEHFLISAMELFCSACDSPRGRGTLS